MPGGAADGRQAYFPPLLLGSPLFLLKSCDTPKSSALEIALDCGLVSHAGDLSELLSSTAPRTEDRGLLSEQTTTVKVGGGA